MITKIEFNSLKLRAVQNIVPFVPITIEHFNEFCYAKDKKENSPTGAIAYVRFEVSAEKMGRKMRSRAFPTSWIVNMIQFHSGK